MSEAALKSRCVVACIVHSQLKNYFRTIKQIVVKHRLTFN
nr:MAG TPA: hypothetical protein [Caudoviricetes sp.]